MKASVETHLIELFKADAPGFLYVEQHLIEAVSTLRSFWSEVSQPEFKILYSVKSNPNAAILSALMPHVDGFDVSSQHEAALLRRLGVSPQSMTWSGPAKTERAIADIYQHGVECLHLDSFDEWRACYRLKKQRDVRKSIRLTLSDSPSRKLGFSVDELRRLTESSEFQNSKERFSGIHAYLGRDAFSVEKLSRFIDEVNEFRRFDIWDENFTLYLGPGLPAITASDSEFRTGLVELLGGRCSERISIECGRAVAQPSGYYFTRVLAVKHNANTINVILDGGLQHLAGHLRSPSYGQQGVEVSFYRGGERLERSQQRAEIQGSLSIWHDTLLADVAVPNGLQRGDWIVIGNCGAYGYTAACNQFIGPTPVGEWMLSADGRMRAVSPKHFSTYLSAPLGAP